jgi:hypothetical protein
MKDERIREIILPTRILDFEGKIINSKSLVK